MSSISVHLPSIHINLDTKILNSTKMSKPTFFLSWQRVSKHRNSCENIAKKNTHIYKCHKERRKYSQCFPIINLRACSGQSLLWAIQADAVVPLWRTGRRYWHPFWQKCIESIIRRMVTLHCRLNLEELCMPCTMNMMLINE